MHAALRREWHALREETRLNKSDHPGQLVVPPEAEEDTKASEVLRAWIAKEDLHCSLRPTIWSDPGNWGILLADAARHVAAAFEDTSGRSPVESLARIRAIFNAELDRPTADRTGGFHHEH